MLQFLPSGSERSVVSEHLCMKLSQPGQGKKLLYTEWPHGGALASSPVLPAQSWVFPGQLLLLMELFQLSVLGAWPGVGSLKWDQ